MKSLLLLAVSCTLVSCEKAREMVGRFAKKPGEITAAAPASAAPGSWVTAVPQGGYNAFSTQPGKLIVIDFHADWCGPCRKLGPILEQVASEHGGKILVGKVNVDQHRELAANEGVRGIPDVRIFRDGREVDRFVGLPSESEVRRRLEIHTKGLPESAASPAKAEPGTPEPSTQPMSKDWLPPGMQRR